MQRMIQVRHVPDDLHRRLKARAAMARMSLSDYLLSELRALVERPTVDEFRERLARRQAVVLKPSAADAVRAARRTR
jgi:hypothetical protein